MLQLSPLLQDFFTLSIVIHSVNPHQPGKSVDHVDIAEHDGVEPSTSSGPSGRHPELMTTSPHVLSQ